MPAGGSFAVTNDGYVVVGTSFGSDVDIFNVATGAVTTFTEGNDAGFITDNQNNLYTDGMYPHLLQVPVSRKRNMGNRYFERSNCTGNDTVACKMPNVGSQRGTTATIWTSRIPRLMPQGIYSS